VLDAQWFGVAQRRRRVFIVGHSGGQPRPEILALAQSVCGDSPPSRETGERTAPTLAARTRSGGGLGTDTELDGRLISFNWQTGGNGMLSPRPTHTDALHVGQTPAVAFPVMAAGAGGANGAGISDAGSPMFALDTTGAQAIAFAQDQRDELRDLGDVAGGLQAEPGMKQQTYVTRPTVRRLTPLECERLQGFPDHWTAVPGNSDTQRYKQLGNAVAVPVVEWILGNIVKAEAGT